MQGKQSKSLISDSEFFTGLPKYFGGKRKLAHFIAGKCLGPSVADCFLGGGSVSLMLKLQEFEVSACDRSHLSLQIGRAYLENSKTRLAKEDALRLFLDGPAPSFTFDHYYPDLFTEGHARFLDLAVYNSGKVKDQATRALLQMLLAKFIMKIRAFGAFSNLAYMQAYNFRDEEEVLHRSPAYYKHLDRSVLDLALECLAEVNQSVFPNGRKNEFFYGDVFEFAKSFRGDTAYLDPPYYGSQSYESYYQVANKILTGGQWQDLASSRFNDKAAYLQSIEELLAILTHNRVARVIFSYGGYKGVGELEHLKQIFEKVRGDKFEAHEIPFHYAIHKTNSGTERGREILIVSDL